MAPKVFISHTSEDKDFWARPLATKLRELGIESWLDEWEIQPGDKLVQKIFTSGIGETDAFVVVLSKNSVEKRWVNAELDVAVVRNIEKCMRLIPVKVDDCEVPTALIGHLHLSIERFKSIDTIASEIAETLHGRIKAPPVGPAPSYVRNASIKLPGVSALDATVLEKLYDLQLDQEGSFARTVAVKEALAPDIRPEQVLESLQILVSKYYLVDKHKNPLRLDIVAFTPRTVLTIAGAKGVELDAIRCILVTTLLNSPNQQIRLDQLMTDHGIKKLHLWAIAKELHSEGSIILVQPQGLTIGKAIAKNEAILKRWATENCH